MKIIFDNSIPQDALDLAKKNLQRFSTKSKVQVVSLYNGQNFALKIGRVIYSSTFHDLSDLQNDLDFLSENGFDTSYAQKQINREVQV